MYVVSCCSLFVRVVVWFALLFVACRLLLVVVVFWMFCCNLLIDFLLFVDSCLLIVGLLFVACCLVRVDCCIMVVVCCVMIDLFVCFLLSLCVVDYRLFLFARC